MLTRRAALTLRIHASLLFFLSVAMIIRPIIVLEFLGFETKVIAGELLWSFRMAGSMILLPALLGPIAAAFAGERGLRQAAAGMGLISLCVAVTVLFAPVGLSPGKVLFATLWFAFALLYLFALRGRGRNR